MRDKKIPLVLFSLLCLFLGCKSDKDVKEIKLGHGLDITHPVHKAMVFMGERLEEKSEGTLTLAIYPNQQLGSERECLELLQIGSLGMTKVSTAVLENFVPSLKVFGLPFLFKDREHRFSVLDSKIGEQFLNESVPKRLKGLTFYDAGSRSFYTKTPVETPEDLEGLKLRVMESASAITMVKLLGGSPTPISSGELYTALQQGIVDGAENNPPTFFLTREYELCNYYTLDEHTSIPDELLISTIVWDKLSREEQKWVKEAAMESAKYQREIWLQAEIDALEKLEEAGVIITRPEKSLFREKVQPMYDSYSEDPQMEELIKAIQAKSDSGEKEN